MKKGLAFTFIEMIVVIGVIAIALPTLYAIFFLIMQQQIKISRLAEVKRQGDFVVNTIDSLIKRGSVTIHSGKPPSDSNRVCIPPIASTYPIGVGTLYFLDKLGSYFYFDTTGSPATVASESSIPNAGANLTSTRVIPTNLISSCTITTTGYSSPVINFSFDLCYNVANSCATGADTATLHFESTTTLPPQ